MTEGYRLIWSFCDALFQLCLLIQKHLLGESYERP